MAGLTRTFPQYQGTGTVQINTRHRKKLRHSLDRTQQLGHRLEWVATGHNKWVFVNQFHQVIKIYKNNSVWRKEQQILQTLNRMGLLGIAVPCTLREPRLSVGEWAEPVDTNYDIHEFEYAPLMSDLKLENLGVHRGTVKIIDLESIDLDKLEES